MAPSTTKDVPAAKVGEVVQSYIDNDNKTSVKCALQPIGKWTIEAND